MNSKTFKNNTMKKANIRPTFVIVFTLLSVLLSCKTDNLSECPNLPSFQAQVLPIILNNCATSSCHSFGGFAPFLLTTHQEIDSAVINRNFLMAIKHQTPYPMPRINPFLPDATKLSDSLIQIIECWINQGRPNN